MQNNFNLSEHIEKALKIYENVKTAKITNSTGCYILTSQSEFIHISFIEEFIKQINKEIHEIFKKEEEWNMDDRIWFEGNIMKTIKEIAGDKFK